MKDKIKWIFAGFISLTVLLSILYFNEKKEYDNERESTSTVATTIKKEAIPSPPRKDYNQQPVGNNKGQVSKIVPSIPIVNNVITKTNTISPPHPSQENDDIVAGLDMTFDELKALHDRQMEEIAHDSEFLVTGIEGVTIEEVKALHEKQRMEIASENDWDEIVIASSGYGDTESGLTRAEVTRLHKEQNSEWENADDWDEILPLEPEQNSPLLTTGDIIMLQDEQKINILRDMENPYQSPAPSLDEGGVDMTVQQIKELHSRQAKE